MPKRRYENYCISTPILEWELTTPPKKFHASQLNQPRSKAVKRSLPSTLESPAQIFAGVSTLPILASPSPKTLQKVFLSHQFVK
jgi:hypothetical protein